jgi:hypothetical protein
MVDDKRCEAHNIDGMVWYEASMISTFPGVFDDCEDNFDVEDCLREAGVILPQNVTDTESCALVVYFNDEQGAEAFGERLQDYVEKRENGIE